MASQLYDYWFVQFDFPDKNGKPYKSSGGKMVWCNKLKREIPDEWMILSINDLATTCRGVSYDASQVSDTKTPKHDILVLRGNNIKNSHIVLDSNTAYISSSLVSPEQRIHRHDIIMTMSSGSKEHLGKCGMFQFDSQHTFGAFLTKLTPKKDYHYYVFSFLMSAWYKAKIKSICNGTGINNLTNEIFNQVLLPVPPNQYICLFNSTVSASFDRIGENEMQTEELSKQRDELLPLLMNGQVSVKQLNNHLSAD
jgi:type I restriction enzyme S subunit